MAYLLFNQVRKTQGKPPVVPIQPTRDMILRLTINTVFHLPSTSGEIQGALIMRMILVTCLISLALSSCKVDSAANAKPLSTGSATVKVDIAMRDSTIAVNGKSVRLGQPLNNWKMAVPGQPRCTDEQVAPIMCTWDNIGLQVGTDDSLRNVKFASLFLLAPKVELVSLPPVPDGRPAVVSTAARPPQKPFTGRLQLDGVDITAKTPFSYVRGTIDQSRKVRCGSRDCSIPHGKLGNGAQIFFELDGRSESDPIARIGLSLASENE